MREARQNLSVYLERASRGERLTITDHGRPVATLGPPPPEDPYEAMVAAGRITPAKRRVQLREIPPLRPGERSVSQVLQEMRDEERF